MWEYQTEEGTHDMFMDLDEVIRFRVIEEIFVDTSPTNGESAFCNNPITIVVVFRWLVQPKLEEEATAMANSRDCEAASLPYSIVVRS